MQGFYFLDFIHSVFGNWDNQLTALLVAMVVDYIIGISVAFCGKSPKSDNGKFQSTVGINGLIKKGVMLLVIWISFQLDVITGMNGFRKMMVLTFLFNEVASIIENCRIIGVDTGNLGDKLDDIMGEEREEAQ